MQKISQNNPESFIPTPEELELIRKHREDQEKAGEMLDAVAEHSKPAEVGVPFDRGIPSDKLVNQTTEALQIKPQEVPKPPETSVSDQAQHFIDRLVNSKSEVEATAIMNEVLQAAESGKISPSDQNEIYSQSTNLGNQENLPKAA
jgi:hypothetical protein